MITYIMLVWIVSYKAGAGFTTVGNFNTLQECKEAVVLVEAADVDITGTCLKVVK